MSRSWSCRSSVLWLKNRPESNAGLPSKWAVDMPVCPSCGGPLDDGVCRRCATSGVPAPPAIADNIASALCYLLLGVTGVLFLWLEPYSRNRKVRFHAFQAIFVHVAIIVFWES